MNSDICRLTMSEKILKKLNIMPVPKIIKREVDEDEDKVRCKLCSKTFISEIAVTNHVKMEHFSVYISGDKEQWLDYLKKEDAKKAQTIRIQEKTDQLISTMEPTSIMSLASQDVSYIIVKSNGVENEVVRKRKRTTVDKPPKEPKTTKFVEKRDREVKPISGPFECLQPSSIVEDGKCHQIFFSCCEYSIHYRDEHTRKKKSIRCQVCEKLLMQGMEDAKFPFACQLCLEGFNTNKELTEHINKAHVKLKPYQCSICNKRFTQQGGLQQHLRMHTGIKPFECTYCAKSFTQKSGLEQHLRTHTKSKPFCCVVCHKTFCQSVHLKQHMRTHTNVAPFQCGLCNKKYKQSSHLNYHLRSHSTVNMTDEQKEKYKKLIGLMDVEQGTEAIEIEIPNANNQDGLVLHIEEDGQAVVYQQDVKIEPIEDEQEFEVNEQLTQNVQFEEDVQDKQLEQNEQEEHNEQIEQDEQCEQDEQGEEHNVEEIEGIQYFNENGEIEVQQIEGLPETWTVQIGDKFYSLK